MRQNRTQDFGIFALIVLSVFIYFPEVASLKMGFLSGDHRAQHYPWAAFYAEGLKQFHLPWWTSLFHCGFPLLAEGQVGAFYPLNLIFYFLLPLKVAYNYEILFHYVLGACFFILYLRHLGLSPFAVLCGTLIYLYGTPQGGYYYNTISQKVLIWLPLTFYLSDLIVAKGKKVCSLWLAAVLAIQVFGGYLQYAIYSIGFTLFYFLWVSILSFREQKSLKQFIYHLSLLGTALILCGIIAAPQLGSTWELAQFSRRFSYPLEFAFVGSLNPLAFATLFFPHWDGFLKAELYLSAFGIFFILVSWKTSKTSKELFFWVMAVLGLLLALGKYNPLFVAIIKLTGFSGFRIPTKFLFFVAFALSVLSAFGLDKWMGGSLTERVRKQIIKGFVFISALAGTLYGAVNIALRSFRPAILSIIQDYLSKNYVNSPIHPHPLEYYIEKSVKIYDQMLRMISIGDFRNVIFLVFIVGAIGIVLMLNQKGRGISRALIWAIPAVLFLNLYFYGMTSVKGNLETFQFVEPDSKIIHHLKTDDTKFRTHRIFQTLISSDQFPVIPHANMLFARPIIGGYSPFLMAKYYRLLAGVGDVNDSYKLLLSDDDVIKKQSSFIDFLHVKYVLADHKLVDMSFKEIMIEDKITLYENPNKMTRAFFVSKAEVLSEADFINKLKAGEFSPTRKVYLTENLVLSKEEVPVPEVYFELDSLEFSDQQELRIQIETPVPGYLVLSDLYYPGWKVFVNGVPGNILQANGMFRSVKLQKAGKYEVLFRYEPVWKTIAWFSMGVLIVCLLVPMVFFSADYLAGVFSKS